MTAGMAQWLHRATWDRNDMECEGKGVGNYDLQHCQAGRHVVMMMMMMMMMMTFDRLIKKSLNAYFKWMEAKLRKDFL